MLKIISAAMVLMASVSTLAAQQTHFACRTRSSSVITVQEDAGGNISLNRTESERVAELGMTAMTQKQILLASGRDATVTSTDNGNSKLISMQFHGTNGDSQVQLQIKKVLFGHVELIHISGTGAAMARVNSMINSNEQGISFGGCRIELD